ncbi:MAG: segregation/condensation protein A [Phaeodactylibacter sp.]|nr:segregation/condensation protein A [Phaeodactylibacter sp.]MCB9303039.1 segregation/condensation protein A [Lewinellaceae bacterium]HQU57606.1 segregation/condensation protein A [Saprospiraceae bacterium]
MEEANSNSYTIKLPQFEGPFDLLLFFIERDELDIYDIPIAKITDDFLGYIRHMEQLNIDLASEFILVAATLCRIKAKLLLPRKPVDEEGNEIDPREELVSRLLEYKRYKSVLEEMRQLEELRSMQNYRGNASRELQQIATKALVDNELESVTLFKLLRAFERVMQRFDESHPKTVHRIVQFSYTIEEQQTHIFSKIAGGRRANFSDVFSECQNRIQAIVTFLALLELLNLQQISIIQGLGLNNFWLEERPPVAEEEE